MLRLALSLLLALVLALAATGAQAAPRRAPPALGGEPAPPSPAACSAVRQRCDCGYSGITPALCQARGCCYAKAAGQPSCFYAGEGVNVTVVHLIQSNHFDVRT